VSVVEWNWIIGTVSIFVMPLLTIALVGEFIKDSEVKKRWLLRRKGVSKCAYNKG